MNFVYKHFYIYIYDNKVKYINTKNNEEYYLTFNYLNLIINKAGNFQLFFNGYNLEVLKYIKYYILPAYLYINGVYYYSDYVKIGCNQNIVKTFVIPTFSYS